MAKSSKQKIKILYLRDYLRKNTNEDNPASVKSIVEFLKRQEIAVERKTVYDDVEQLREYGEDIVLAKGKYGGYFCASTEFDLPEIKALVDSVQSSKFISEKLSLKLIKKLEGLTNIYDAKDLHRQVIVRNRVKSMQESVFNNVDHISSGINHDRTITFKYYTFDIHKKPVYKNEGNRYEISPFSLVWDNENYYLLGYDAKADRMKHFRVDKMEKVIITDKPREGKELFAKTDLSEYGKMVFGMFAGREETVTMRFANTLAGVVIDRFGSDIIIVPDGDNHFTVKLKIQISPQFIAWLFGFGQDCEVLSPGSVREEVLRTARQVAELYG